MRKISHEAQPLRWKAGTAALIAAVALNTAPAEADHEDVGVATINTGSFCDPQTHQASLEITIANHSGIDSNFESGHVLHAYIEHPYGEPFEETLEPGKHWGLGGPSGSSSAPAGKVDFELTWEGHDDGEDYTSIGTLDFPPVVDCPDDGEFHDGDKYFFPDIIENYDENQGGGEGNVEHINIAGEDRYETAVATSENSYSSADDVVIATGENYPDALAGAPLAEYLNGPLLLSRTGELPQSVIDEIDRLGATRAMMLGGKVALSLHVEQQLQDLGLDVVRLAGEDRYATATHIAEQFPLSATVVEGQEPEYSEQNVFVVNGENFPDALSASVTAARNRWPIMLTRQSELPEVTADYLSLRQDHINKVIVGGGSVAVSATVEIYAKELATADSLRLAGSDRYATSVEFAKFDQTFHTEPATSVHVATGRNFPDALTAASAIAHNDRINQEYSSFVLVDGQDAQNAESTYSFIANMDKDALDQLVTHGGSVAISETVQSSLAVAAAS